MIPAAALAAAGVHVIAVVTVVAAVCGSVCCTLVQWLQAVESAIVRREADARDADLQRSSAVDPLLFLRQTVTIRLHRRQPSYVRDFNNVLRDVLQSSFQDGPDARLRRGRVASEQPWFPTGTSDDRWERRCARQRDRRVHQAGEAAQPSR